MTAAESDRPVVSASMAALESDITAIEWNGYPLRLYRERIRNSAQFLRFAHHWTDREYLVTDQVALSFAECRSRIEDVAASLVDMGIQPKARVMIHAWNSPEWVLALWAIWRAGAAAVLSNPHWSREEIAQAIHQTKSTMVLASPDLLAQLPTDVRCLPIDMTAEGAADAAARRGLDRREAAITEHDIAVIAFTSGTTAFPRAVPVPHRGIVVNLQGIVNLTGRVRKTNPPQSTALMSLPLFHIGGPHLIVRSMVEGERRVFLPGRFDAGVLLEMIERHQIRSLSAVPTMLSRLLEHPDIAVRDLSSLQTVTFGAAPVPPALTDRLRALVPHLTESVNTGYGLTEAGGAVTAASARSTLAKPGTVGRALPWAELRIDNPDGEGEGEVLVRSGAQMLGYLDAADPSDTGIDPDGWIATGDLGQIDEDGDLWITGRSKDLIIRGGENISPLRIESILLEHPAVVEAAVIGVPHADLGEQVVAIIRARESVSAEQLSAFLRPRVAAFERPSEWRFVEDEFPTTANGKVMKRSLVTLMRDVTKNDGATTDRTSELPKER